MRCAKVTCTTVPLFCDTPFWVSLFLLLSILENVVQIHPLKLGCHKAMDSDTVHENDVSST